jgi:DNA-binding response OmpR family regulator
MTVGVIEREKSFLAKLIALACESAGHHCLVFKDIAHVTRVLPAVRVDTIVLTLEEPGLNPLDWLETMTPACPDLPARTLLLAESEVTPGDMARAQKLGAELVTRPFSLVDVELVVMERLLLARP